MDYSISNLKTLAVVTAATATHKPVKPFKGTKWIAYRGPAGTFSHWSFSQVYWGTQNGKRRGTPLPANLFRGKIVVVGATASNLQDIHATSTDNSMPGPEIQANAIETVIRGFPISSVPGWLNVVLIVLFGVGVPLVAVRARPVVTIAIAVGLGIVFAVAVQLAFNAGWVVSFVYPLAALILSSVGSLAVQLVTEAFERIRAVDLFARFVPENVVDELLASSDGLRLGGVQREGTIMFTDLRGFTSFSEKLTPPQVIDVLNHYLSEMSDAILDNGGTLVAYMGDGIFAVFGAPLELPDHADRALRTAREMLEVRLPRFNEWIRSQGLGDGFRMGIGLNSGHVMSGHVGSERRVEYAAVGDTTNTASRIESLTKGTPAPAAAVRFHPRGAGRAGRGSGVRRRGRDPRPCGSHEALGPRRRTAADAAGGSRGARPGACLNRPDPKHRPPQMFGIRTCVERSAWPASKRPARPKSEPRWRPHSIQPAPVPTLPRSRSPTGRSVSAPASSPSRATSISPPLPSSSGRSSSCWRRTTTST